MFFYPSEDADPRLVPIQIDGSPHFAAEIFDILIYLHLSAGMRTSKLIVDGILRIGDAKKAIHIIEDKARTHNAVTAGPKPLVNCHPSADDPLANPGEGALSVIVFNPFEWGEIGQGSPGGSRDEILLHEMVHAYMYQRGLGNGKSLESRKNPKRVREIQSLDEFYGVMITNVYCSERQRPIRNDHVRFSHLDQTALGLAMDPAFASYFTALKNHAPDLVAGLSKIDTRFNPWNPRHKLYDLLDAQLY